MVASRAVAGGGVVATAQCKPGGLCGADVLREDTHENTNHRRRIGDRDCDDRGTRAGKLHDQHGLYAGRAGGDMQRVLLQRELYDDMLLTPFLTRFELLPQVPFIF